MQLKSRDFINHDLVFHFGELYIVFAYFKIIGKYIENKRLDEISVIKNVQIIAITHQMVLVNRRTYQIFMLTMVITIGSYSRKKKQFAYVVYLEIKSLEPYRFFGKKKKNIAYITFKSA